MRRDRLIPTINISFAVIVLLVIILSLSIGVSVLIFHSILGPLIFIAICFLPVLAYIFLYRPLLLLYLAIFAIFLPQPFISWIPSALLQNYLVTLLVILALSSWSINSVIQKHKINWKSNSILLFGFAIWSVISLLWASDLTSAQHMLVAILLSIALMVTIINQIVSINALNGLMNTLALIGWMLVLLGLRTVLVEGYSPGARLSVLGINENNFGVQLIVTMPGVLWQAIRSKGVLRVVNRILSFLYLAIVIGLIAMSGSRGSGLSLIIILLAFCLFKTTRVWGVLGLFSIAVGVLIVPQLLVTILERLAVQQGDTLLGGREVIWQAAWNLILDHIWLGVGIGNARQALLPYVSVIGTIGGNESAAAHNPALQVWSEIGLPGVILYLGILVNAVWLFIRQYLLARELKLKAIVPYFTIIASAFLGYMFSWIKAGGIEYDYTYFLMLSFLLIPSYMHLLDPKHLAGNHLLLKKA